MVGNRGVFFSLAAGYNKNMVNQQIAKIFYSISEYLAMDEVPFKPQAYEKAGRVLEGMSDETEDIYKQGGLKALKEIPGVGESMAEKIEEYIKTKKIKYYEQLKKKTPVDLEHLTAVQGLGPKNIKLFYKKLKIKNLEDLERAALAGKISQLPRCGAKLEKNILRSIEFLKRGQGRMMLGYVLPLARKMEERLKNLKEVKEAVAAGSVRRRKETVGDLDILVISDNPGKIMDYFCSMPEVEKMTGQGETKCSVRLYNGLNADVRVVDEKSFGSALQYFTGNKDHNIELRKIAQDKGFKLNEYGLFRGKKQIVGASEKEIYRELGLQFIPPEMRENTGEINFALSHKLPKIVEYDEIISDLHIHSDWSDGGYTIEEMARAAKDLGRRYVAITDHAGPLKIAGGLNGRQLLKQMAQIEKIDQKTSGIRILKGAEVDIDKQGNLCIEDEVLAGLDLVVGAVHDNLKMSRREMTHRICRAMENSYLDVLAHPSGRKLDRREAYDLDWDEVFKQAAKTKTALEINSYPDRSDLGWQNVRRALQFDVRLAIGTDAHSFEHLSFLELGTAVARRGWAKKENILNCLTFEELKSYLK